MQIKRIILIVLLLMPVCAEAGFNKISQTAVSHNQSRQPSQRGGGSFYQYSKRSASQEISATKTSANDHFGTISFLFAVAGLGAVGAMIAFIATSLVGVYVAAAAVILFGLVALGTGYISAYNHKHKKDSTLATFGLVVGMIECLPVLLVGGLFLGIVEIGRFVFRKKHKGQTSQN